MTAIKAGGSQIFVIEEQGNIISIESFIKSLFELRDSINNNKLWYRGQPNCYHKLLPSVGREHKYLGINCFLSARQEIDLLHRFRRRIGTKIGKMITPGEAMFLARHHKLPTRLLDWTANALYGLYFSCCEEISHSGSLWAIRPSIEAIYIDVFDFANVKKEEDLFNYKVDENGMGVIHHSPTDSLKIIHPFYGSERIISQDGAFTLHSNPWHSLEDYANITFQKNALDISILYHWNIPHDSKLPLMKQLSGLGITHRTLFPDLDGISKSLLETEVLWNGIRTV